MSEESVVDEGIEALSGTNFEPIDEENETIPAQVSEYFYDFGRRVRKMQYEGAHQVMIAAVEAMKHDDAYGYGRTIAEKSAWKEILIAIGHLATAEAHYIQMPFLCSGKIHPSRKENEMKKQFTSAMEHFLRTERILAPGTVCHHICEQCLAYCNARLLLIACHKKIVAANESHDESLDTIEDSLRKLCTLVKDFHHPLLSELAHNFNMESELLKSLISLQRTILYKGILETTVSLKELQERLQFWFKDIDWGGEERRGFFSSGHRHNEKWYHCRAFSYLHSYHAWLTLKYSFLYHETLSPYINPLDMPKEGEESIDGFTMTEVLATIKKKEKDAVMGILIDRSKDKELSYIAGRDYRSIHDTVEVKDSTSVSNGKFPILFIHSSERSQFFSYYDDMMNVIRNSQQVLDDGRRVYHLKKEPTKVTTLWCERLESRLVLVLVIPSKRTEKDAHIVKFFSSFISTFRGSTIANKWRAT